MKSFPLILTAMGFVQGSVIDLPSRYPSKPGYATTFFDDFTQYKGSQPSDSNWIYDLGTSYPGGAPNWGNNENQTYTKSPNNIQIGPKQTLSITPRLDKGFWTSSRIETQRSDFAAKAGGKLYLESRILLGSAPAAKQQGIWPAFWALGAEFRGNYTNWPQASEWDFLEVISGGNTMYSTVHCGYAPGGPCNEYNGLGSGGVPFSRGVFHTVGFMVDRSMVGRGKKGTWKDETLYWYLDGTEIFSLNGTQVGDEPTWENIAHKGHFLLLNVAVGGNWPGQPNSETIDGASVRMEIDYVGVWNSL